MVKNIQYYKFCAYGFLKNLRFFEIFFILFLKDIGLSYLSIGLLYSIRQITINLMEIPSGLLADSFGRKRALLFSFFAYLGSFIIFYFSVSFRLLALAMILYGFGEAFRSGTHKAIILHHLKSNHLLDQKTRYYGSTRSWSQFGSAVVSLLAAVFFYLGTEYRTLFLFTVLPYVVDLINVASYPPDPVGVKSDSKTSFLQLFKSTLQDFIQFFHSGTSFRAMLSSASYIAFFKTIKDYLQPMLLIVALQLPFFNSFTKDTAQALVFGGSFFIIFLLTSLVSRNAYKLEERLRQLPLATNILYIIGTLSIALAGFFVILQWQAMAIIVFVLLYLVQNARRPLMVSYLSTLIDSKILASGLSAASQLETVIIVAFAPLLGLLIDWLGIGGGLIAGSSLFLLFYPVVKLNPN